MESVTLGGMLDRQAQTHPSAEALVFPSGRATYGELMERTTTLASALIANGVRHGDRVGILIPPSADVIAAIFACARIGAIAVPINARYRDQELAHVIVHSGMKVLFSRVRTDGGPDFPGSIRDAFPEIRSLKGERCDIAAAPELETIVLLGDPNGIASDTDTDGMIDEAQFLAAEAPAGSASVSEAEGAVHSADTAVLVYTSGTTAAPKGAMLSHRSLLCVARGLSDRLKLTEEDRVWTAIPLFHGGGINYFMSCLDAGATFVHPSYFDAATTLPVLEQERVTVALPAFETIWLPVLDRPDFDDFDLSRIRVVLVVGVVERLRAMSSRLPHAIQVNCVAMTESSAFLSLSRLDDPFEARMITGGQPLDGMQCRVVDPETAADVGVGETGELLFRGPNTFDGYFRDADLTAAVFDAEGWYHTGDLVSRDRDGRITFVSRLKDMLKVGGENVAAAEVEGYLLTHPAVGIVQVVAAPDARYVEVPAAFIELAPGGTATEEELIEFCLDRIAGFRVPRYVRFVTEWPMSGTKIKKAELRSIIAAELRESGIVEAPKVRSRWSAAGTRR